MNRPGGDDLDDDFVFDDLVAMSEEDLEEDASIASLTQHDDNFTAAVSGISKKRKRREKEKERKKRKLAEATEVQQPESIAARPPALLAVYLSSVQDKTFSDLSSLELDEMRIPDTCIADTSAWAAPRTLDHLGAFIAKTLPALRTRLSQKSKSKGAPTLIFITGAALRVVDVTRVLKDKSIRGEKGGEIAKLFARHFKVEEHVAYLRRTRISAAVGTPGRIGKLLCESDALSVSALTHIMLDSTFRDVKKRTFLDIPETRDEVFRTVLGAQKVREALRQGKVQVVLF